MKEIFEFRVPEENAAMVLPSNVGKVLSSGSVRKVIVGIDDKELLATIKLADSRFRDLGRSFFHGWTIRRDYSEVELQQASLFHLRISGRSIFEPAGQECGTVYDDNTACPFCGSGGIQRSALHLNTKRIPKGRDFAKTIAGELVISRRGAEVLEKNKISGVSFGPIHNGKKGLVSDNWFQLLILGSAASIVFPTITGNKTFDTDPSDTFRCPLGHVIGLNLLSEITISIAPSAETDLFLPQQYVGIRQGLLRPERPILARRRFRELVNREKLSGLDFEVANLSYPQLGMD